MKDFKKRGYGNQGGFSRGPRPQYGSGRPSFGRDKEMFKAECNQCHKTCEVPFRPNGKKPVYCRDCFVPEERQDARPERRDHRSERPERTFQRPQQAADPRIDDLARKVAAIDEKLTTLIAMAEAVERSRAIRSVVAEVTPKAVKKVAKKTTKKK